MGGQYFYSFAWYHFLVFHRLNLRASSITWKLCKCTEICAALHRLEREVQDGSWAMILIYRAGVHGVQSEDR